MKLSKIIFVISIVLSGLFQSCSSDDNSKTEGSIDDATLAIRLQGIIDDKIGTDADKLVGVAVSIRIDGEERWNLVGGISKLNIPIEGNMRFGVGSITKTVVAATVMKLVDDGVLTLNDQISDWLAIDSPNVNNVTTIFQLLIHSSGINGYMYPSLWDSVEANLETPIPAINLVDYIGPPLDDFAYSNSNYLLLGLIIEAATQKTVGEVMREKFWSPLGLNNIYFGTNEGIEGPIATPWRDSDGDGILEDIADEYNAAYHSVFFCAADVFSTASDLSMWADHLYNGNAISESSQNQMMTSYYSIPDAIFTGYGLGARKNVYVGHTMWGHTGGMRGYGSHMFFDPTSKVSIAVLNNQSRSSDGPTLRHELITELLEEVFKVLN
jgi:D-alanyl-D-alanine carboxypeptidase